MSVWGEKNDQINVDGVYDVTNVVVQVYNGIVSLSTNLGSSISSSDETIEASSASVPELKVNRIPMPPRTVNVEKLYQCSNPRCRKNSTHAETNVLKCKFCGANTLNKGLKFFHIATLHFDDLGEVKIYQRQLQLYFQRKYSEIPADEDDVCKVMLCDSKTVLLCNTKNTCFAFEH